MGGSGLRGVSRCIWGTVKIRQLTRVPVKDAHHGTTSSSLELRTQTSVKPSTNIYSGVAMVPETKPVQYLI